MKGVYPPLTPQLEACLSDALCNKTEEPLPCRLNFYINLDTENPFLKSSALLAFTTLSSLAPF